MTRSGRYRRVRPCDATDEIDSDPIVDVAWPRADLRAGTIEFLISLLATACRPEDRSDWGKSWKRPPTPADLAARFEPFESAFNLDGPGPRFLQDRGDLGKDTSPVAGLLIEQPGANTEKNNGDLFLKRGRVEVLGRSTAAIALFALQAFAPSGGAGHRTSLRGGGPLTTLALCPEKPSLWHLLWLNVTGSLFDPLEDDAPEGRLADVFPWLAPTRTSEAGKSPTTGANIHPAQTVWGMPRRIRLDFEPNVERLACAVTGEVEDVIVKAYRTRPYGVNYTAVLHPLTPYYRMKPNDPELLPVHPRPGGTAYRYWLGFVMKSPVSEPAACVVEAKERLRLIARGKAARLRLLGFDMDNMKARGFVEADMPLFVASDSERQQRLDYFVSQLVAGAVEAAGALAGSVKTAIGTGGAEIDVLRERFYRDTELAFFQCADKALAILETFPDDVDKLPSLAREWVANSLKSVALAAFDAAVPVAALIAAADFEAIKHMVAARRLLAVAFLGLGTVGNRLYAAVGLAAPAAKAKAKAKTAGAQP